MTTGRLCRLLALLLLLLPAVAQPASAAAAEGARAAGEAGGPEPPAAPSVVLIAFDGLPTSSLLDAKGAIDPVLYPAFADLARHSIWATAAATVATRLLDSIPALVTGRHPGPERRLAIEAHHPDNLFSWLEPDYLTNVLESDSVLQARGRAEATQASRLRMLRADRYKPRDEEVRFRKFVAAVQPTLALAGDEQPTLHFAHVKLPRVPWRLSPAGRDYRPDRFHDASGEVWGEQAWFTVEAYQRHLLQLRFCDRLLGELLTALRDAGLFERALVIVTATSGAGFWPGEGRHMAEQTRHPEDVLLVPLFVKRPGQREPVRVDRVVETVDVLPTIAQLIGREIGWETDGCSVLSTGCDRAAYTVLRVDERSRRHLDAHPAEIASRRATLERKLALFGDGSRPRGLYAFGPHAALVGRATDELPRTGESAGHAKPHPRGARWSQGEGSPRVAAQLWLDAPPASEPPEVAVALNGRIETVVPAPRTRRGKRLVLAMVPDERLREAGNVLSLHLVIREGDRTLLAPLELR